jgi:hypothetical protein
MYEPLRDSIFTETQKKSVLEYLYSAKWHRQEDNKLIITEHAGFEDETITEVK